MAISSNTLNPDERAIEFLKAGDKSNKMKCTGNIFVNGDGFVIKVRFGFKTKILVPNRSNITTPRYILKKKI